MKKDLHDYNQQGTYNRLSHSTPASSLPSPDTLGAAFHKPHPSPLKEAVKAALSPADAPAAEARSSHTGTLTTCASCNAVAYIYPAATNPFIHAAGADRSIQLTSATADTTAEDLSHPLQPDSEAEAEAEIPSLQTHCVTAQAGHHAHQQPRQPRSSVAGISTMDTCGPELQQTWRACRSMLKLDHCCRLAIMNGLHRSSSRREQPKRLRPRRNTGEVAQVVPRHDEGYQPRFAHASTLRRGRGSSRPEPHHQVRIAWLQIDGSHEHPLMLTQQPRDCRFTPSSKTAVSPGQPIQALRLALSEPGAQTHARYS